MDPIQSSGEFPKGVQRPASKDVVQVLMTEEMARLFEKRCLGQGNTVGPTHLAGPMLFREDDLPTYIIGVDQPAYALPRQPPS